MLHLLARRTPRALLHGFSSVYIICGGRHILAMHSGNRAEDVFSRHAQLVHGQLFMSTASCFTSCAWHAQIAV